MDKGKASIRYIPSDDYSDNSDNHPTASERLKMPFGPSYADLTMRAQIEKDEELAHQL